MEKKTVDSLFSTDGMKYSVPIYQRRYVWTNSNWEHLWTDIKDRKTGKEHFTGVIVTLPQENKENGFDIIDGQQRLTTFQIILCAIQHVCGNYADNEYDPRFSELAKSVDKFIKNLNADPSNPSDYFKLSPTDGPDRSAFNKLVSNNISTIIDYSDPIPSAYKYFKQVIKDYVEGDHQKMSELYRGIRNSFYVIQISLDEKAEPAAVFESINGRGRTLDEFDHLRNNLFLRAGKHKRADFYYQYWQDFNINDLDNDAFLRLFLQAKLGKSFNNQMSLFDLYKWRYLKNLREARNNCQEDHPQLVEHEFQELRNYSSVYTQITNCDENDLLWFYKFLQIKFETTSWYPLILYIKSELSELNNQLIFRILESYIVRCMLSDDLQSFLRERSCLSLDFISWIREQDSFEAESFVEHLSDIFPPNEQVQAILRRSFNGKEDTPLIRYILFQVKELIDNPAGNQDSNFEELCPVEQVWDRFQAEEDFFTYFDQLWPLPNCLT